MQLSCHFVAVVLALTTDKTNKNKYTRRNNTKNTVQTIQNTINTSTRITKTHTHIIKQVKTNTVQDIPK